MKILVTGCTAPQVGRASPLGCKYTPRYIAESLTRAGHAVQHRVVEPGERVDKAFDRVVVCWYAPNALTARFSLGALWAMHCMGPELATVWLDDWNHGAIYSGTRRVVRNPWLLVDHDVLPRHDRDRWRRYVGKLIGPLTDIAQGKWYRVVVSAFPWVKLDAFKQCPNDPTMMRWFDPSPAAMRRYQDAHADALAHRRPTKRWLFGSLNASGYAWVKRQGLSWPIDAYGNARKFGQAAIPEVDLIAAHARAGGTLSYRSSLSGTGWWRTRFVHAAQTETFIAVDEKDRAILGDAYAIGAREFEAFSPRARAELARAQSEWFNQRVGTRRAMDERINQIVKERR